MGHVDLLTMDQWRRILMSSKQKLYSYVRWSSEKQSTGTPFERQRARAKPYAHDNCLEYVEIQDSGASAFKGKNSTQGRLGEFIANAENLIEVKFKHHVHGNVKEDTGTDDRIYPGASRAVIRNP